MQSLSAQKLQEQKRHALIMTGIVHAVFLFFFLVSYGMSHVQMSVPKLVHLRLGAPAPKVAYIDADEHLSQLRPFEEAPSLAAIEPAAAPKAGAIELQKLSEPQPVKQPALQQKTAAKPAPKAEAKPSKKQQPLKLSAVSADKETAPEGSQYGNSTTGQKTATYLELLQLTVQETSQIPAQARQDGLHANAILRLTFNRKGYVTEYALQRPTGYKILDDAAIAVAQTLKTSPFPPMPDNFEVGKQVATYDFPISFKPE